MNDINEQIAEIDQSLVFLSEAKEAAKDADRPKWQSRIDAALDKRLVLMKQRDSGKEQLCHQ